MNYIFKKIEPRHNAEIAEIVRYNLKNHSLDIPGTAYFDKCLDDLCAEYSGDKRAYYVLVDKEDKVVGGIGFAEFTPFENCAELQKLYLADSVKGNGLGYELIRFIEEKMRDAGFSSSYLETHKNLEAALHIYEKSGYKLIERPSEVAHGAMTHFYFKKIDK